MSSVATSRVKKTVETVRASSGRGLIIGITALVVLAVSGLSCATYIGLMGTVFPDGLFKVLCYSGAFANFALMIVLLAGKFVWFRPGYHEWASWGVTGVEVAVTVLNLILAFQLAHGAMPAHLAEPIASWYNLAPITPVFSMVGAIVLIATSTELKRKHRAMEVQEEMETAEQELALQQHRAQIDVQSTYVDYIQASMTNHLNSPQVQRMISQHAEHVVGKAITAISGLALMPTNELDTRAVEGTLKPASFSQTDTIASPAPAPGDTGDLSALFTDILAKHGMSLDDFIRQAKGMQSPSDSSSSSDDTDSASGQKGGKKTPPKK